MNCVQIKCVMEWRIIRQENRHRFVLKIKEEKVKKLYFIHYALSY